MKVLHLTTHLNVGGITKYIHGLAKAMPAAGVRVDVLSSGGECRGQFSAAGCNIWEIDVRTKSEMHPKLLAALPRLAGLIRSEKYDLLHAHTRVTQVLAHWAAAVCKIPVVTTCHGFYEARLGRCLFPAWGDRVIAISDAVRAHLAEDFKVPPGRIAMIHNGVDMESLDRACACYQPAQAKQTFGIDPGLFVVGVVARLVEDKGHEYLIRGFEMLGRRIPGARLLIVGDGKYRGHLELLCAKLAVTQKVIFAGNLTDIARALAAIDVFAFPATWREGFGLSIVEAMAVRKPVIITDICAINTLIIHGVNGLKVEPKNPDALAAAVELYWRNPALRRQTAENGRQLVERLFTLSRMADDMSQVYAQVLREKGLTGGGCEI